MRMARSSPVWVGVADRPPVTPSRHGTVCGSSTLWSTPPTVHDWTGSPARASLWCVRLVRNREGLVGRVTHVAPPPPPFFSRITKERIPHPPPSYGSAPFPPLGRAS